MYCMNRYLNQINEQCLEREAEHFANRLHQWLKCIYVKLLFWGYKTARSMKQLFLTTQKEEVLS